MVSERAFALFLIKAASPDLPSKTVRNFTTVYRSAKR